MPVIDQQTEGPELDSVAVASGLVSSFQDPLKASHLLRDMNKLLEPAGLMIAHRLLNANDIALRLSIPLSVAKKIMNVNADVQCGRRWRMSESRYQECVRNRKFKTAIS